MIFSKLFRFLDKPENRTSGSEYDFLMGLSTSEKNVNERSAMQMTAPCLFLVESNRRSASGIFDATFQFKGGEDDGLL